jgi:uncharacterized protein
VLGERLSTLADLFPLFRFIAEGLCVPWCNSVLGGNEVEFQWDEFNVRHLARHEIRPEEAEQVIQNRPLDLESHLRGGENRVVQIGETHAGRILIVVSTMREEKIRVVTAWPAKERFRRYFLTQKRNGNVGRVENQELQE